VWSLQLVEKRVRRFTADAPAAAAAAVNGAIVGEQASLTARTRTHLAAPSPLSSVRTAGPLARPARPVNHKHIRGIHRRIRYIIPVLICTTRASSRLSTDRLSRRRGRRPSAEALYLSTRRRPHQSGCDHRLRASACRFLVDARIQSCTTARSPAGIMQAIPRTIQLASHKSGVRLKRWRTSLGRVLTPPPPEQLGAIIAGVDAGAARWSSDDVDVDRTHCPPGLYQSRRAAPLVNTRPVWSAMSAANNFCRQVRACRY